jgi:hypothetical protein
MKYEAMVCFPVRAGANGLPVTGSGDSISMLAFSILTSNLIRSMKNVGF